MGVAHLTLHGGKAMNNLPPLPDTQDHTPWHEEAAPNFGTLLLIVPASWLLIIIAGACIWWLA